MKAYPNGDKQMYMDRVKAHRLADELVSGLGWDSAEGKGCSVGCTIHCYSHARYSELIGVP